MPDTEIKSDSTVSSVPSTDQPIKATRKSSFFKTLKFSKEFIIVMIILIVIGAALDAWMILNPVSSTITPPSQLTPQVAAPVPLTLTLDSPETGTLAIDSQITVKGKTSPNTTVIFYTDADQNSVESDQTGNFQGTITLTSGINTLTVTAVGSNDEEQSQTVDIVYDDQSTS